MRTTTASVMLRNENDQSSPTRVPGWPPPNAAEPGFAGRLYDRLASRFGENQIFMDVDSIALGRDFRHVLHERLESCDIMLALIGPGWLDAQDAAGNRRLESATDLVRQEIAAALKRNIPVTPVLLQGAQMPPPERLPEDIRELVYRNGFELGHSTWESDVSEMVRRLGLDKESAVPTRASNEAGAHPAISAAARLFKTSWILATFVVIAVIAGSLFYWKPHDQSTGSESEIIASSQQATGPPSQQSAGSPTRPPVGLGAITISNLKTGNVEVYDQNSIAQGTFSPGYAGTISPPTTTLQVPAGTYKLRFDRLFVQGIRVESGKTVIAQ